MVEVNAVSATIRECYRCGKVVLLMVDAAYPLCVECDRRRSTPTGPDGPLREEGDWLDK